MNAIVPVNPTTNVEAYRASTDAAALCREIVVASAMEIQQRKYVKVEGWQAIAIAHGCTGSARDVRKVEGGVSAIGEVRRMSDGQVIAEAEGFVGEDETTWYGGEITTKWGKKTLPKRPDYAIRAMAQTRAVSRACRSAFAHVVVMMNAGLSTTPAEEVPLGGFDDEPQPNMRDVTPAAPQKAPPAASAPSRATKDQPWENRRLGPDSEFPGVPEGTRGKTSHFARQAGDDALFKTISAEIVHLESAAAVGAFVAGRKDAIAKMPAEWRATLRAALEEQKAIIHALSSEGGEAAEEALPAYA